MHVLRRLFANASGSEVNESGPTREANSLLPGNGR